MIRVHIKKLYIVCKWKNIMPSVREGMLLGSFKLYPHTHVPILTELWCTDVWVRSMAWDHDPNSEVGYVRSLYMNTFMMPFGDKDDAPQAFKKGQIPVWYARQGADTRFLKQTPNLPKRVPVGACSSDWLKLDRFALSQPTLFDQHKRTRISETP